jgi:hypothetical protein
MTICDGLGLGISNIPPPPPWMRTPVARMSLQRFNPGFHRPRAHTVSLSPTGNHDHGIAYLVLILDSLFS